MSEISEVSGFSTWPALCVKSNSQICIRRPRLDLTTQNVSSWAGGCLIKHFYEMVTNQMWSFLARFKFFSIAVTFD